MTRRMINTSLERPPAVDAGARRMFESLTAREQEVLRLLARRLTMQIETELFVSDDVNTSSAAS